MSEQRQPSGSLPMDATDPSGASIYQQQSRPGSFVPAQLPPMMPLQGLPYRMPPQQAPPGGPQPQPQPQPPPPQPQPSPQQPLSLTEDQRAFFQQMSPYAARAGQALGIDPNVILAQWAWESGYGSSPLAMQHYNLAGITAGQGSPEHGGGYASYPGFNEFTNAYTDLIWRNFPNAMQAGSDVGAFNQGLIHGRIGSYYDPVTPAYGQGLAQIAATNPYVAPMAVAAR